MAERKGEALEGGQDRARSKPLWLDILDVSAKMLGAIFLLAVAWIGNSFQARLTSVNLQSQREQAESELRANMSSNLISPIAGSSKDGADLKTDREELLVELLALNFHEDFELKPLMEDVDNKLARPSNSPGNKSTADARESLRSIARRVAARQVGSIQRGWTANELSSSEEQADPSDSRCHVYTVNLYDRMPEMSEKGKREIDQCTANIKFNDPALLPSPDGVYTLFLVAREADWKNQTLNVTVTLADPVKGSEAGLAYPFTLTWFDLPLTDNTLLPDGNRFSVNFRAID